MQRDQRDTEDAGAVGGLRTGRRVGPGRRTRRAPDVRPGGGVQPGRRGRRRQDEQAGVPVRGRQRAPAAGRPATGGPGVRDARRRPGRVALARRVPASGRDARRRPAGPAPAPAARAPEKAPEKIADKPPTADQVAFFEKKIRPVLVEQCYDCHSAEAKKVKGGLLLDTREGTRRGGDRGRPSSPATRGAAC